MQITLSSTSDTVNEALMDNTSGSGVSWTAVGAGALAAAALSITLVLLGAGLGLTAATPALTPGTAAVATFTVSAAIWLIVVQWLSAGMGGYLTGRLRSRWSRVDTDEVFFRDTANGFLSWALATVVVFAIAGTTVATGTTDTTHDDSATVATTYYVDRLYRTTGPQPALVDSDTRAESARILNRAILNGSLAANDKAYLTHLVAASTGLPQAQAVERVETTHLRLHESADAVRATTAKMMLMVFVSLLIGAFIAAAAGALGGRHRDI